MEMKTLVKYFLYKKVIIMPPIDHYKSKMEILFSYKIPHDIEQV